MKRFLFVFVIFALTSAAVFAQQLELKEVITRSARGIEDEMPQKAQKAKIALLNFESSSKQFSDYVLDELTSELLETGKVTVVDRKNITAILNEMKFQYSGYVSDESMVSIGKMIGAQYIISGTLTNMETYYRFRIRIINVETAVIQRQITNELKKDRQVVYLLSGAYSAQEFERSIPTANVRNNWLSAEFTGGYNLWQQTVLSGGLRYERMVSPKLGFGANIFYVFPLEPVVSSDHNHTKVENFDRGNIFGGDAFLHFYPWGKKFFLGLALGYFNAGNTVLDLEWSPSDYSYIIAQGSGLAITGEFGWKIDLGEPGGLFMQIGFLGTFIIGKRDVHPNKPNISPSLTSSLRRLEDDTVFADGYWRGFLGLGWAF